MPEEDASASKLRRTVLLRFGLAVPLLLLLFILPAGTIYYWQAWVYCCALFAPMTYVLHYFLKHDPAFLKRRMQFKEKEKEQKILIKVMNIVFLVAFLTPALDRRYGWSEVPTAIVLAANVIVFLSYLFIFWVFRTNSYASRIVAVEKGQIVISTGPYAIVRHPMYLGMALLLLATPPALGSYWAYIIFLPMPLFTVPRLLNEEKVLLRDLPGYGEYCNKMKYRLIPHIW